MNAFLQIAANVATPLSLAGLIATILFFIIKQLLTSKLLVPVKREHAFLILRSIITALFWLSLVSLIIGGVSYTIINVLHRDQGRPYSGVLTPQATLLFSPDGGKISKIQIGQSRVFLTDLDDPLALRVFSALRTGQFRVENIGGEIKVSTQILDREGDLITELIRNEWKVAPPPRTFDRNYTDDALEVRDARGLVVLQVRALKDRVQLQGLWWIDMGPPNGIRQFTVRQNPEGGGGEIIISSKDVTPPPIVPMFQYPSDRHLGELRNSW
jgi:hypothetical protein